MSGQLVPSMDLEESEKLRECEQTIDKGLRNFVDVGMALLEIQQHRLYRGTFPTFAQYCKERWGMSGRSGYRMIESAQIVGLLPVKAGDRPPVEVADNVTNWSHSQDVNHGSHLKADPLTIPAPTSESSIRPLSKLPESEIPAAYVRAVEIAGGEAPTAAQTQQAVDERNKLANAMGFSTPEEANAEIEKPKKPAPMAMVHASAAIAVLGHIRKDDPDWFKAFSKVRKFLNNLEIEWEAE